MKKLQAVFVLVYLQMLLLHPEFNFKLKIFLNKKFHRKHHLGNT